MKGNSKNNRGGGNNRHLRGKKGSNGSNSSNWREATKTNVNDLTTNGYNNHHLTSAFVSLVGLYVEVQKTDGLIYEGILECVSSNLEIHLCHACQKSVNGETLENGEINADNKGTLMFQFCDVVRCNAKNVDLDFAKREQLMTDTAISGGTGIIIERELEKWQAGDVDASLEHLELESSESRRWDFDEMIQENKVKHGYESTFDVTMSNYMSPMETCDEETHRKREQEAERLAREMQKDSRHKDLENADSGVGEEELFSSVSRSSSNSSFTGTVRNPKAGNRGRGGMQAPRFQKGRHQDEMPNNQRGDQRIPNGIPPRHAQQQQQQQPTFQQQQSQPITQQQQSQPIAQQQQSQPIAQQQSQQTSAAEPTSKFTAPESSAIKSYSSVAARKQPNSIPIVANNNTNSITNNNTVNPRTVTRAPVIATAVDPNIPNQQNRGLPKQEHLNKAKQQYIAPVASRSNNNQPQSAAAMRNNPSSTTAQPSVRQQPGMPSNTDSTTKTASSYSRVATGRPDMKNNAMTELSKPLRGAGELQKFGKVQKIHTDKKQDEDSNVSIEKLKEFKDIVINFDKPETSHPPKAVKESTITKSMATVVASSPVTMVTKSPTISSSSVNTSTSTITTTTAMSVKSVATTSSATTTAPSTSTLNPSAKEFNFNPSAKEFKPTFTPKPTKTATVTGYAVPQQVVPQYMNQQQQQHHQQGPHVIMSQHQTPTSQEIIQQQQQQQYVPQIRPQSMVYRAGGPYPTAVYEVPNTGPILNNPPHHNSGYVQQPQMFVLNPNHPQAAAQYHQQQMMSNQQGQPFVPVQQAHNPLQVRVLNPVQQRMVASNFAQDGSIPTSYILQNAGTAHSVANPHQSMTATHSYQQPVQQTPSSPAQPPQATTPQPQHAHLPAHQQQYVINNQNSNAYHQQPHISIHSQGTAPHYQRPIVMVPNYHHPGGQQGMMHNFQQGN